MWLSLLDFILINMCVVCAQCDLFLSLFLQDNLFEWHFSVRGPPDSDFDGGVYHGRIVLPPEYPMKPPSIILLTVRRRRVPCHNPIQLFPQLKRNGKTSNQMIKEWKTDSVSFNPQPFLVATHQVTVFGSKPCLSTHCRRELLWFCENMRLSYYIIIFRQLYDSCANDRLIKAESLLWQTSPFIVSGCSVFFLMFLL